MPSLDFLTPSALPPPPGLSPIAATPVAPVEGAEAPDFAGLIAALAQETPAPEPAAPAPMPSNRPSADYPPLHLPASEVADGAILPPERPMIAGLSDFGTSLEAGPASMGPALPNQQEADKPGEAEPLPARAAADDEPIACGLRDWRLGGTSTIALARTIVKPPPAPAPPPRAPEIAAAVVTVVPAEQAKEEATAKRETASAPEAPPGTFAPIAWALVPAPAGQNTAQPAAQSPALAASIQADAKSADMQAPPPGSASPGGARAAAASPIHGQQPLQTGVTTAPAQPAAALPHGFALPPEVAREVAQLVRTANGDSDEAAPSPAPLPDAGSQPPAPAAAQPAASLHTSFAPSHRPVIDTGRAEWLQNMIERIAEMPQADGKREAQLRLLPDALGPVEVKIEQREQRLHVTMNAQTPEARQLLSDAAPKLQELAEARGIRFAQTGFGGADAQDRRSQPDHQPATPLRPRPAEIAAGAEPDDTGDLIA